MLKLFGMPESDYKRFMNFLAAHDCTVDFREFRTLPGEPGCPRKKRGCRSNNWSSGHGEPRTTWIISTLTKSTLNVRC